MDHRIYGKPMHQPAELFRSELAEITGIPWPCKAAAFHSFVKKKESVAFPKQGLDPVGSSSAEQEENVFLERIQMILCIYDRSKSFDPFAKVSGSTYDHHLGYAMSFR